MKYCSRHHENPDEALFCHECGEKLPQVTKDNVCPDCKKINPQEAKFCFNCGCSLEERASKPQPTPVPKPPEFYYLRVGSPKVCDKIVVTGNFPPKIATDTIKEIFKIPKSAPIVDVIVEYEGKPYKYKVDCRTNRIKYINWGYIRFKSNHPCDTLKISGNNMSAPLVLKNVSEYKLSVPVGTYELEAYMDENVKKRTVTVNDSQTSEVHLHFIKKYTLTITSDVGIDYVKINKIKHTVSTKNNGRFSINLEEGTHDISICVRDSKSRCVGEYQEKINLDKNKEMNLQWCKLELDTNAIGNITISQIGGSPYSIASPSRIFLILRGYVYELTLVKPNNGIFKDTFKSKDSSLKLLYRWKEFKLIFNRYENSNLGCYYCTYLNESHDIRQPPPLLWIEEYLEHIKSMIPRSLEDNILLPDPKVYGVEYRICCHTMGNDYKSTSKIIDSSSKSIVYCTVSTELNDIAKWMWLRKLIFYITWCVGLIILIFASTHLGITYYNWFNFFIEYEFSDLKGLFLILSSILFISSLVNIWFYYKLIKKRTKRKWNLFLCSEMCIIILGFTLMIVSNDKSFDIKSLYWLFLWPVLSWLFVGGLSYLVYRVLMIKGWSIWETMWTHK